MNAVTKAILYACLEVLTAVFLVIPVTWWLLMRIAGSVFVAWSYVYSAMDFLFGWAT